MKTILVYLLLALFCYKPGFSQGLDLLECYNIAKENSPLIKNPDLLKSVSELNTKNYSKNYFPLLALNGQATYQSDITKVDIPFDKFFQEFLSQFPNAGNIQIPTLDMPEPKKDQYKVTVDVSQVIYDGGITKAQKELEAASLNSDLSQIESDLYQLKEKINKVYFGTLLVQESVSILQLLEDQLDSKIKVLRSGLENGVAMQSNIDQLVSEKLKVEQQVTELSYNKKSFLKMLSILIGKDLDENTVLKMPEVQSDVKSEIVRPELMLIDSYMAKLDASKKLLAHKNYPKLYGFGQVGYGRPGFNMFSTDFDKFWIVGVKLNWNFWDWNYTKNQKKVADIQKEILSNQKENLNKNFSMLYESEFYNIEKYEKLIAFDEDIIKLKTSIVAASSSKLENGIITATEYIDDLNAESQSKINMESHKIQLIQTKINCQTISGN